MAVISTVKKNYYQDSMKLMQISQKLSTLPGVKKASAIMATESNLKMLRDTGLIRETPDSVGANDLIVALEAESEEAAKEAIEKLDSLLIPQQVGVTAKMEYKSFDAAYSTLPQANIAIISVPGSYAKLEAVKAIENGLHTFLFSDNLTIEEEIELKERAKERGLLVMGPGCGTAIINGIGLGFANVVRRGPVGVVAAAGTGMQEVTSLIHNSGSGISHAIGLGGRDLSEKVGGIMAVEAIKLLQRDEDTKVLLIVSKPPSERITKKVLDVVRKGEKPAVVCFLGKEVHKEADSGVHFSSTLEDASLEALKLMRNGKQPRMLSTPSWKKQAERLFKSFNPKQRYIRGLFSGGTLCYEAQQVLTPVLGKIFSNAPLDKENKLDNSNVSKRHTFIDLGEEEFTVGRPHPMIDATLRSERLRQEASDSGTAVILFDVVLGYVASPDPAGDLLPAIKEAKMIAKKKERSIAFVAHVCGTGDDPQNLKSQEEKLKKAGVLVFPTNALASRVAGWITTRGKKD
ncbi:MAG TPA: acyl-CoA synthetase FdrA [Thermodesulfobacteriota bacterium]|nr:acyl-CoA synthetase FdrA [Thermodesulfobacteriota bacterium]